MEAGTGKTRVAIEIVNSSPCSSVLWVGPLRTLDNTKKEVSKWGGFSIPAYYYGIESIQASDRIYLEIIDLVKSQKNMFVVVDESLKIKNHISKRTRRMLKIGEMVEYKLILNGTPMSKNILDIWAQMEFLSPLILKMSYARFKDTFCTYTRVTRSIGYMSVTQEYITGHENLDYLYSLIEPYVYHSELTLNVEQNYKNVYYSIDEEERIEYYNIKEKYLSMEDMLLWNNNIFMAMTQKMQHSYCCSDAKIKAVKEILKEVPEEQTIIFCKFIDSRLLCERIFPKAKILSFQKESFGLNLQEYNHTIYFDKIWDYALYEQSTRRTYRTGQSQNCKYYNLTGDVGLEALIDRNIGRKISITEYFKKITRKQLEEDL